MLFRPFADFLRRLGMSNRPTKRTITRLALGEQLEDRALLSVDAVLVKDISTQPGTPPSNPGSFTSLNATTTLFTAETITGGRELWVTNGTTAGTTLVKDIFPGSGSSNPTELTVLGTAVYFFASDGVSGRELWKSDGTIGGTTLVKDIMPGSADSRVTDLTNVNGTLFFSANDGIIGSELWQSNGTPAGTILAKDIDLGAGSSYPEHLTAVGNTLYFAANDGSGIGRELWKTDAGGTTLVLDIKNGPIGSYPMNLTAVGNTLYFTADDDTGIELWKSDAGGTSQVADLRVGPLGSLPDSLTAIGATLYFAADDGTGIGRELWKSDAGGTALVADINGTGGSYPMNLTAVGSTLYFAASDGINGRELWKSDTGGTSQVKNINGPGNSDPESLTNVGGVLYFTATDGLTGRELWSSDGSSGGTTRVADSRLGSAGSNPANLANINGSVMFSADGGTTGAELWKSNGTAAGTVLIKDISQSTTNGSSPGNLTNVNGTLFLSANDGIGGAELWKSDGSAVGTTLVKDIATGGYGSSLGLLTNVNGTLFFTANDGFNGNELWKSNGSASGTVLIQDILAGGYSSVSTYASSFVNVGGVLYFTATDGVNGRELWKTDGTTLGTVLVKDIQPGPTSSDPGNLTNVNGVLYFTANDGTAAAGELWMSNGTPGGTVLVKDINPTPGSSSYITSMTNVNGVLYFTAADNANGFELWKSNGTGAGTTLVADLNAFGGSSYPRSLAAVNNTVYFSANDGTTGTELWKSDGLPGGTVLVKDIRTGVNVGSYPSQMTNANGTIFFVANNGTTGDELWVSNGTSGGTVLVKDIMAGPNGSHIMNLTAVGSVVYFTATDLAGGDELWTSDGTAVGTVRVRDIATGVGGSNPSSLTNVNGTLYFVAQTEADGAELWKVVNTTAPTVTITSGTTNPTNQATIAVTVTFSEAVSNFIQGDLVVAGGTVSSFTGTGTSYSFNVTSNGTGLITVDVPANAATNAGGNGNTAATQLSRTIDQSAPTVTISSTAPNPAGTGAIPVTVTFNEAVLNFIQSDLTVSGGTVSTFAGSGTTYTFSVTATGSGPVTINIAANVATDLAGNGNTAATQFTRNIDTSAPTVAITSTSNNPTSPASFPVTVTFSEAVTGFIESDVVLAGATLSGFSGSGTTYSFTATPTAAVTLVTVNIAANVALDGTNNGNTAATQFSRTIDRVAPGVVISSTSSDPTNAAAIPITVTFSEAATGFVQTDVVVNGGTISGFSGSGAVYNFSITPTVTGLITVNIAANVATDLAGNANTAAVQLSRTSDLTAPSVVIGSSATDPTNLTSIPIIVTFSDAVTGFTQSDVAVSGGTVSGFAGGGNSYSFNVAPTPGSTVVVNVAANVASDSAGNGNSAAAPFSRTFDSQPPAVVSLVPVPTSPTNATQAQFTVTFNEAVSGVTADDFKLALSGVTVGQPLTVTGSGTVYTVTVAGIAGNGTVGVNLIDNGSIRDAANNNLLKNNGSGDFKGQLLTLDQTTPKPSIGSVIGNPTVATSIPVTVTFSEPVTGFAQSDLISTGGSISNFAGSGVNYTFTVTAASFGLVTVEIPAGVAIDTAGNANPAAVQFSRLVQVAPTSQDGTLTLDEDQTQSGVLVVNDPDNPPAQLTITVVDAPLHGQLTITDAQTGAYTFTGINDYNGPDSFTFQATDAAGLVSNTAKVTITISALNDPATITGSATGSATEDAPPASVVGNLTVTDVDTGENVFQSPSVLTGTYGTFAFDPATGAWSYVLDNSLPSTNILAKGQTDTDTLIVTSADGTATQSIVVTVTGQDDLPVIGLTDTALNLAGSKKATVIDKAATFTDADSPQQDFTRAKLTINGQTSKDTLAILVVKNGKIQVKSGTSIQFNKVKIATVTRSKKGAPLTITFNKDATNEAIQELLRLVTFKTSGSSTAPRTISMQLTFPDNRNTLPAKREIQIK